MPSNLRGKVSKIVTWKSEQAAAETGDSVGIVVNCKPKRGDVCGLEKNPPIAVTEFLGEAVLLGDSLKAGEIVELRCGTGRVKCKIKEIREKIDSETGAVVAKKPRSIKEHEAATIVFSTGPIAVEKFADIPELGRFVLVRGRNIGAGIVLETKL